MIFEDLGLEPSTLKAIAESGYTTPTPIQAKAIPIALMGRDVMGIAQTGTGKTAGFTLPMIDILASGRSRARMPRALILCPTRELAAQAADNFTKYSKYADLNMALIIGGTSFVDQEKALERACDVLIATPGRLLDLFERGKILLNDVKYFVIDEADRMLDMGFIPDVERIAKLVPRLRQTLFFSATMDKEIRKLSESFLMNPKEVAVDAPATTAITVTQALIMTTELRKRETLRKLLKSEGIENGFIFCNRKKEVDILYKSLTKHGFNAVALHGDMAQSKRMEMLEAFKSGQAGLLVCSDVAARGLDVSAVPFVVNFDVPNNAEDYVHRIGRTGRAGMQGKAFTLALPSDNKFLSAVEKLIGSRIPRLDVSKFDEKKVASSTTNSNDEVLRSDDVSTNRNSKSRAASRKAASNDSTTDSCPDLSDVKKQTREDKTKHKRNRGRHDPDVGVMDHGDDVMAFGAHTPSFLTTEQREKPESELKSS